MIELRIKASDMERMFAMSANGIRLYEKHGVIRPKREGTYRIYSQEEMQAMGCGVQLRRYGFGMPQTAQMLGGMPEEEQLHALECQVETLEQESERLMQMRKSLRIQIERARHAQQLLNCCVVEDKPAMYFLGGFRGDMLHDEQICGQMGEWIDRYAPHLSAAMLLDGPYFTQVDYDKQPLCGLAVDAQIALELGLKASEETLYLPPKPCVLTAVRMVNDSFDALKSAMERVRSFAGEKGLLLYAGGLIRLVQCVRREEGLVQTGLLWARIKDDEKRFGGME